MTTLAEHVRAAALEAFDKRKRIAAAMTPIDNSRLAAGMPMCFYCHACGSLCDVVAEDYLFPPNRFCSQCRGLIEQGWIANPDA